MQIVNREIRIDFNDKLKFLFEPAPYKVMYGGRGGGKSEAMAQASLILGAMKPLRIGCFREIQKSIRESMHETLAQAIERLKLMGDDKRSFYKVKETEIVAANGTNYFFAGLRHNLNNIKSIHGIDLAMIDEAQPITKYAWDVFEPTIRKDAPGGPFSKGSEIWISFNPELDTDETYSRYVLNKHLLPPNSQVVEINYWDNKFFPEILRLQMETAKKRNYQDYLTVWEGKTRVTLDGAIFAKEIQNAESENRICRVNYDKRFPVETYWDLGQRDHTAVWFVQRIGMDFNIIDFYQNTGEDIAHYIAELQKRPYNYGICYLPHDGNNQTVVTKRTVYSVMRAANFRVRIVPRVSKKTASIQAARLIFDQCYFDRDKTYEGMQALRRYKYKVDKDTGGYSREPEHDENSDAADAFQQIALNARTETEEKELKKRKTPQFNNVIEDNYSLQPTTQGWML